MAYIGARVKRSEDVRFLRGVGKFVADLKRPYMLHAAIFRSPCAHARITRVDTEMAVKFPGVVCVLTFADLAGVKPIPMRTGEIEGLERCLQSPLAQDNVRYVGEPVAVVVAEDRYLAEDGLELINFEYEPLGAAIDTRYAMTEGAPILHQVLKNNVPAHFEVNVGDVDSAMADADVVIDEEFYIQRHGAVPLETRGLIAEFDESRQVLNVWGPTKIIHRNRQILAGLLDLPESSIHFIEPDVGGGFGARGEFYPEDYLIPLLALRLRRPICWIEDRRENLIAMNQAREQWHRVKVAIKHDGTILAFEDELLFDMGAYTRTHGGVPVISGSSVLRGPYSIRNYRCRVSCVLTNKTPVGTYRSPGRYEGAFVRERVIDSVAHRLGLDPAEVRRRNFVQADQMPYDVGPHPFHKIVYDSGNFPDHFETALARVDYTGLRASCEAAKREGRAMGIGLACYVETVGRSPWEYARIEIDSWGKILVYAGCANLGQGVETFLSQIVADELHVSPENIRVIHGDTDLVPYGMGTHASRSAVMAGNAAVLAARKVKEKLFNLGAAYFEIEPNDLVLAHGAVSVRGASDKSIGFAEIARMTVPNLALKQGVDPGISESAYFSGPDDRPFPYGAHVAMVEVDRETGFVELKKYLVAQDVGRVINPMIVEGQMVGGAAQGIGGALLEEFVYGADGQPLATSFMDYLTPTAMEVPNIDLLLTEDAPSPLNPLGVKGAGEGGIVAVGGAIANAVSDALGAEVTRLPLKPEYVLKVSKLTRERLRT